MKSTTKTAARHAPTWLNEAVYEPKRQRTFELVKQAVGTLTKQREQDGITRISLNTIMATACELDPVGKGVAHTAILENEEAYAYYKRHRTASKPTKQRSTPRNEPARPVIKTDRDQTRVRQCYRKLNREELVDHLLVIEQQYAELHECYLGMNDKLLEWQLRAEAAETALSARQAQQSKEEAKSLSPVRTSTSKPRQHKSTERTTTTGPLPRQLVSLVAFANQHSVSEQTVLTRVTMDLPLLPAKRGEWTDTDGAIVTLALDSSGRAAFHQLYHELPSFAPCKRCPHQETETPVGRTKQP